MFNRKGNQQKYWCFGFLSLFLLIFGVTCIPSLGPDPEISATVGAVADKAETAVVAAQTTEARVDGLEPQVETNRETGEDTQAAAEAARRLAETAIARTEESDSPDAPSGGPGVPLNGGVTIAYDTPEGIDFVFYSADGLLVNRNYANFETEDVNQLSAAKTVALALVETGEGTNMWHLLYAPGILPITNTQVIRSWSEYTIFAEVAPSNTETVPDETVIGRLTFEEGPRQNIVAATEFEAGSVLLESLGRFKSALQDRGLSRNLTSRLLLVEEKEGQVIYTAVAFDPGAPAGTDSKRWYCRVICRRWCSWICR